MSKTMFCKDIWHNAGHSLTLNTGKPDNHRKKVNNFFKYLHEPSLSVIKLGL